MLYATEYRKPDGLYGDTIEADSWDVAQKLADARGRGEKVIGSHCAKLDASSHKEADTIIDAMNDRDREIAH